MTVLVLVETTDDGISEVSQETLTFARDLGDVRALVVGGAAPVVSTQLGDLGVLARQLGGRPGEHAAAQRGGGVVGLADQVAAQARGGLRGRPVELLADLVERDAVERVAKRARIGRADDARLRQHHQVGVIDGHQRREQQSLGVFEIFVQYVGDVLGGKLH